MTAPLRIKTLHVLVSTVLLTALDARAALVTSYNVFAGREVKLSGFINSATTEGAGPIGSNQDIRSSASGKFQSLAGGGTYYGTGVGPAISGNIAFAKSVNLGGLTTVGGDVSAGINAVLQGTINGHAIAGGTVNSKATIAGNLASGGDATTSGFGKVSGNLLSNGNVHLGANVLGNVNYGLGDSITTSPGVTIGGSVSSSNVPIVPIVFDPVIFPAAQAITTGATNFNLGAFTTKTFSPGHYGQVTLAGSNTLNFSAGDYYFTNILMTGSFLTINYNLSSGPINIYLDGNAVLKYADTKVNGTPFSLVNPGLASQVNFEAHGNIDVNSSNMFGTFFAPYGNITIKGLSNFRGGVYAGNDVIADGTNFYFGDDKKNICVPEPSSYVLLAMALAAAVPLVWSRRTGSRT